MLTDEEKAKLIEFCAQVNELGLNEKDEQIIRHLLTLVPLWELRAKLYKKKKERTLKIEKGMSFSDCEKAQMREYTC
jgi:hypothetical protein